MRKVILHINGGIGKNIMATAVAKAFKREHPDDRLIVVTAWPQVWLCNPNIWRVYRQGATPYFFEDHVKDQDIKVLASDPYNHEGFIQNRRHLIDVWCEQSGVEWKGEMPNIHFTAAETGVFSRMFASPKPIFIIQTNGGAPQGQKYNVSWERDLPLDTAQKIVDWAGGNGYHVIHIRLENQPALQNAQPVWRNNIRELFGLLRLSISRLLIDSFAQHACAAMGMKSVVCWPIDNTRSLGYEMHDNVVSTAKSNAPCLIDSYLRDFNIAGELHECPFTEEEIFRPEVIIGRLVTPSPILSPTGVPMLQDQPEEKMKCLVDAP